MTINRIITTLVQLMLVGGAIVLLRMMWQELKYDMQEMKKDLRK